MDDDTGVLPLIKQWESYKDLILLDHQRHNAGEKCTIHPQRKATNFLSDHGTIIEEGPPEEIFRRPKMARIAFFLRAGS
jgi:hypothetical protein